MIIDKSVITYPVTGVELNQETAEMYVVDTEGMQLTATIIPDKATNKAVTWTSSDPDVATVDQTGHVSPVGIGTTIITVTTSDGQKVASCSISIIEPPILVSDISCPESLNISFGSNPNDIKELASLISIIPENATNKSVTWESSNPNVATVDQDGNLTLLQSGTTSVIISSVDGNCSVEIPVTVPSQRLLIDMLDNNGDTVPGNVLMSSILTCTLSNQSSDKSYTVNATVSMGSGGISTYFDFRDVEAGVYDVSIRYDGDLLSYVPGSMDSECPVITFTGKRMNQGVHVNIVHVESVTVTTDKVYVDSTKNINPGKSTVNLSSLVQVYPENATNKTCKFTLDNEIYGTIKNGVLTIETVPLLDRTICVSCSSVDGKIEADKKINVSCGVGTINIYPIKESGDYYTSANDENFNRQMWDCVLFEAGYYQRCVEQGAPPVYADRNRISAVTMDSDNMGRYYFQPIPLRPLASSNVVAVLYRNAFTNPTFVTAETDIVLGESGTDEVITRKVTINS